ncbi:unnamed protein product [Spirodela intermedia]|uniref:MADS-box domain-containing protein n=1 Tax=Spirodela intermedia TaxID=51605 RepID=A0A7I8K7R4_SPIIN|nr:unnamed protein product [Spirodela intermedia]
MDSRDSSDLIDSRSPPCRSEDQSFRLHGFKMWFFSEISFLMDSTNNFFLHANASPSTQHTFARLGWFPGVMEGKPASSSRRKVTMELIAKKEARDICFTKRRQGLFKKLCELSRLCGVDTLALVSSSAGKLYPFGTPDVPTAVDRFLSLHANGGGAVAEGPQEAAEGRQGKVLRELFDELHSLETRLRELQQQRAALARAVEEKASRLPHRWRSKPADLPTEELQEMLVVLENLQEKLNNVSDAPEETASGPKQMDIESIVDQGFTPANVGSPQYPPGPSSFPGFHDSTLYVPISSIVPVPSPDNPSAFSVRMSDWEAPVKPYSGTLLLLESVAGSSSSHAQEDNPERRQLGDISGLEGFWENGASSGADTEGTDDGSSTSSFDYMDFLDIPADQD